MRPLLDQNCTTPTIGDRKLGDACNKLRDSIKDLTSLGSFVRLIDPEAKGWLSIDFYLTKSTIHIGVENACVPSPLPDAAAETQECVTKEDMSDLNSERTSVDIQPYTSFYPPRVDVLERGVRLAPFTSDAIEDLYGRDVRLRYVVINTDIKNKLVLRRLPRRLTIIQGLYAENNVYLTRTYHLHLANVDRLAAPGDDVSNSPVQTTAMYVRDSSLGAAQRVLVQIH